MSTPPRILHMLVPTSHVSPFDVNMAADAGFGVIVPYTGVSPEETRALVQDAIFSRPPGRFASTGVFIGGWDINVAADMFAAAREAQVPPFEVGVFTDPNGAYTTAGAMVAMIEKQLKLKTGNGLAGCKVVIYGGGPVGISAAVLVAQAGGEPVLARLTPHDEKRDAVVARFAERYQVALPIRDAQTAAFKMEALEDADVVITAAKAGIRILTADMLKQARRLVVAADVNAVPPAGIEGVGVHDKGVALTAVDGAVGIGALAIGNVKYKTQHGLFKRMLAADKVQMLDFPDAYQLARELV
ncbi:MAG TPA: methylenetetrahydromethanopterin dehydrogenase [Thiolinea sp.]|nr:methylenetetrahydromethanopterin dehydrogenase [Thiolinea sp.]